MSVITKIHHELVDLSNIQAGNRERFPFLLESVAHNNGQLNQFSILFAHPEEQIECRSIDEAESFFLRLNQKWQQSSIPAQEEASYLPFTGGWFVYLSYEMAQGVEPSLQLPEFKPEFPIAYAVRCPAAIIVDHAKQQTIYMVEAAKQHLLSDLILSAAVPDSLNEGQIKLTSMIEEPDDIYTNGIKRILEYIASGDVFQVNLSREWNASSKRPVDTTAIYKQLCRTNPAPFACLLHHADGNIVSSSPERLVRVRGTSVETRPIAGTRPRSHDKKDRHWLQELRDDDKERAEHIMLIDLERNDIGRVCQAGTVEVDELMTLESYEHVHHIVSNIKGELKPDVTPVDVLKAVFPGGTITGCPKVRCMEIIAELEQQGRGPYTGSAGYINHDGSMDFNILIRTLFIQDNKIQFRAGAGIVADSRPEHELKETRHKAKGLLLAISQDYANA